MAGGNNNGAKSSGDAYKMLVGLTPTINANDFIASANKLIESVQKQINAVSVNIAIDEKTVASAAKQAKEAGKRISESAKSGMDLKHDSMLRALDSISRQYDTAIKRANTGGPMFGNMDQLTKARLGIDEMRKSAEDGSLSVKEFSKSISNWRTELGKIKSSAGLKESFGTEEFVKDTKRHNDAIQKTTNLLSRAASARHRWSAAAFGETGNSYKQIKAVEEQAYSLRDSLKSGSISVQDYNKKWTELNTTLNEASSNIKQAGKTRLSLKDAIMPDLSKLTRYLGMGTLMMKSVRSVRNLIDTSIRLDDVMTQLKIVTMETSDVYDRYANSVTSAARKLGLATADLIDSTTTFARLGYSIEEASRLAEKTSMLKIVGDIPIAEAQDAITSILKAFNKDANDVEDIIDKLVIVGNNFPVSVQQISEGMTNASSALSAAGNSFEQSVALMTAANTTIQNASKSSTGLRTIAARLRNTKAELDDLGEAMTAPKYGELVDALTKHNVKLTEANGEYRATYDIMKDLASVWDEMTSQEQAALATQIAGVRQQAVFFSIIDQFKEASGAMDAMANSTGALQQAYDIQLQSITAHINQFKASIDSLAQTVVKSNVAKAIVDVGTSVVSLVDDVAKLNLLLPGLIAAYASYVSLKRASATISKTTEMVGLASKIADTTTSVEAYKTALSGLNEYQKISVARMASAKMASNNVTEAMAQQRLATLGLTSTTQTLGTVMNGMTTTLSALWKSMSKFSKVMLVLSIAIPIVSKIASSIKSTEQQIKEATEELDKHISTMNRVQGEYQSLAQRFDEISDRYLKLSQKAGRLGEQQSLTNEEYAEYKSLNKQIADIFPELNMGLSRQNTYILDLNGSIEEQNEKLRENLELKRKQAEEELAKEYPKALKSFEKINKLNQNDEFEYAKKIEDIKGARTAMERLMAGDESLTPAISMYQKNLGTLANELGLYDEYNEALKRHYDEDAVFGVGKDFFNDKVFDDIYGVYEDKLALVRDKMSADFAKLLPGIIASTRLDGSYLTLSDEGKKLADSMLQGIKSSDISDKTKDGIDKYIQDNILSPIRSNQESIDKAYKDLLNIDPGKLDLSGIRKKMWSIMREATDGIESQDAKDSTELSILRMFGGDSYNFDSTAEGIFKISKGLAGIRDEASLLAATPSPIKVEDLQESSSHLDNLAKSLKAAKEEMKESGSVSAETALEIASYGEDYAMLLREEHGQVKLNEQAYIDLANAKVIDTRDSIIDQTNLLREQNDAIREIIQTGQENGEAITPERIAALNAMLAENTEQIKLNQMYLGAYPDTFQQAMEGADGFVGTIERMQTFSSYIDEVTDSLTTLADIQAAVADSMEMPIEQAMKFAQVYPEILNSAEMAADGQIKLNEDVVNALISGNKATIASGIEAKISELKGEKEVHEAKLALAEWALEYAKEDARNKGELDLIVWKNRLDLATDGVQALVEAGVDTQTAHATMVNAMSMNEQEFAQYVQEAASNMDYNMSEAFRSAAQNAYNNMYNTTLSIGSVTDAAHSAAMAVSGIGSGTVRGDKVFFSGAGGRISKGNIAAIGNNKTPLLWESENTFSVPVDGYGNQWSNSSAALKRFNKSIDLQNGFNHRSKDYTIGASAALAGINKIINDQKNAIASIDGQIAALESIKNAPLEKFRSPGKDSSGGGKGSGGNGGSGGSGGSGGRDYSAKEESEEAINYFELMYKYKNHMRSMDAEEEAAYFAWLQGAFREAYDIGEITLDDFYRYQEEVYKGLQGLFKEYLSDMEHEISMRQNYKGENAKIISMYEDMLKAIEKDIAFYRKQGLNDTDDYIQELQSKWQSYTNTVKDMREKVEEDAKSSTDRLVKYRIDMIKKEIDSQKEAFDKQLKMLKEFYDEQKKLLKDEDDKEKYLEEQSEKRKGVTDIQRELNQLELDDSAWAQKRKIELSEQLLEKQKDLDKFEKDHALQMATEKLDEMYSKEEEAINKQKEALEDRLGNAKELYDQALNDVRNGSVQLYEDMIEWNNKYGDGISDTIKTAWEDAYVALKEYSDLYQKSFNDINLSNATGWVWDGKTWNNSAISGTNPNNVKNSISKIQRQQNIAKEIPSTSPGGSSSSSSSSSSSKGSSSSSAKPSIPKVGTDVTVKTSARRFSSRSGNVSMASFVPGGKYRVYQISGSEVLIGRNGVYTGWVNKSDLVGYASGTSNAKPGLNQINEKGFEYIFQSKDGNKYKLFSGGEKVLNANATEFLYEFANKGDKLLKTLALGTLQNASHVNKGGSQPAEINMGDIIVNGNANEKTVSEIRRVQREGVDYMLREFSRLQG
jgi:TP901 family phage tail tape measure protein